MTQRASPFAPWPAPLSPRERGRGEGSLMPNRDALARTLTRRDSPTRSVAPPLQGAGPVCAVPRAIIGCCGAFAAHPFHRDPPP